MYLGSSFHSCSVPRIRQRDLSFPFDLIVSPLQLLSAWSRSVCLMVQWYSSSYWWFPGVCEMSQPSWGGGPASSPPHARMTSSLQPSMQLRIFDDDGLSCLQHLFDFHVSVRFCEPFPIYRGHLGCIVSHVLKYYCIIPGCYSTHIMYVEFIILFFCLVFLPACTL